MRCTRCGSIMQFVGRAIGWYLGKPFEYDDYTCTYCGKDPADVPVEEYREAA